MLHDKVAMISKRIQVYNLMIKHVFVANLNY